MNRLRVVVAEGGPWERGRQIGRELGELIEQSLRFYQRHFERRGVPWNELEQLLAPYLAAAEGSLPMHLTTLRGMAEAALAPMWELFAVNAFEELERLLEARERGRLLGSEGQPLPPRSGAAGTDRCSSFTVAGEGFTLLGHNEQWLAGDAASVAVIIDKPGGGAAAVASPTVVCCLPAVGMSEHRGGQAIQSLTAADDGPGVPRVLVSRHSLESRDRADAVLRASLPERAGGYGHVFAFAGGDAFTVETTGRRETVLEGPGPHTNHYLDPALGEIAPPPTDGSSGRYERLLTLLEELRPDTPEQVMAILRDHEGSPQAICLHPREEEGEDASAVLFSMVCDLEAERMWVAAGNPCTAPYEEIDLTAMAARASETGE